MIELSSRTLRLIETVIPLGDRERIARRLREEASEIIPFCENRSPEGMERIRFSILRVIAEGEWGEDEAFYWARTDWRDLFLAAGHGEMGGHEAWARQVLERAGE